MKTSVFTSLIFLFFIPLAVFSQKKRPTAYDSLDFNMVKARIWNGCDMFWDLQNSSKYEVPKVTGSDHKRNPLFSAALWIGGFDTAGNLHEAAMTYRQNGNDFFPGPIRNKYDSAEDAKFNRIWKISAADIDKFRTNGTKTKDITSWPGNGDTTKGELKQLAPYVDVNKNGKYEPDSGDYPSIRGCQSLYYITNDAADIHGETGADPLNFEVQVMAYETAGKGHALDYTTLFNYKIINRSQMDYDSLYLGIWTDFDLGNPFDDYIGCDTALNAVFAYNGKDTDADWTHLGGDHGYGYGSTPPSQAFVFLNAPLNYMVYYANDFSNWGNPSSASNYYSYLTAHWKNGDAVTYGGDGHSGGVMSRYMFPGDPSDPHQWSEEKLHNQPGDRRALGSYGPINLKAGSAVSLDVAFVYAIDSANGRLGSVKKLKQAIKDVQNWYNGQNFDCGQLTSNIKKSARPESNFKIYPNPANDKLNISLTGNPEKTILQIMDLNGRIFEEAMLIQGQKALDISSLKPGIYLVRCSNSQSSFVNRFIKL